MHNHTLHRRKKDFCRYFFKVFGTKKMLKSLKIALKLMANKNLLYLKKAHMLNSKIMNGKQSHKLEFMQILKVFQCQKIMESKI